MTHGPFRPFALHPLRLAGAMSLVCLLAGGAAAQTAPGGANQGSAPPYEGDLMQLAEMLGALHYLRPLCGDLDAARWRGEMQGLLDTEQPSDERRSQLTAAFNRGYDSYRQVYRSCTPSAELAAQRYLDAGAKLSHDIATRYGSN